MNYTVTELDEISVHFIVAQPRTGSSLLRNILNHHKNIIAIGEKSYGYFLYPKYKTVSVWTTEIIDSYCKDFSLFSQYNIKLQFSSIEELKALLLKYQPELNYERVVKLTALCFFPTKDKSAIKMIVFKELIMGNYIHKAAKMFPKSKFILLYRNPLDNVARLRNMEERLHKKQISIHQVALKWKNGYGTLLRNQSKIDTHRTCTLFYEELIQNQSKSIAKVCAFLGIGVDQEMFNYQLDLNQILTPNTDIGNTQYAISNEVYLELYKGAFESPDLTKIGLWKQELTEREAQLVWKICQKVSTEIGYSPEVDLKDISYDLAHYKVRLKHIVLFGVVMKIWYASPFFIHRWFRLLQTRQSN